MLNLKNAIAAASAVGLLVSASAAFAGRYGDAEIRHSQIITQLKQSSVGGSTPCRCDLSEKGQKGKSVYQRSPFQKHRAG